MTGMPQHRRGAKFFKLRSARSCFVAKNFLRCKKTSDVGRRLGRGDGIEPLPAGAYVNAATFVVVQLPQYVNKNVTGNFSACHEEFSRPGFCVTYPWVTRYKRT
jgi:hypothetical protein